MIFDTILTRNTITNKGPTFKFVPSLVKISKRVIKRTSFPYQNFKGTYNLKKRMRRYDSCSMHIVLRVNHSNVAFFSWSMLYQHTRHRNSNKFKTLCQKLASVFGLPAAQTRNCRRNYQIFSSSRKTLKMTFFHRYVLRFKNYLFE